MAAAPSSSSDITDGPVLNLINKRIRALRKKLNRITQMEEYVSQGKVLNKEQEETYRSKPSVLAGIEELEKLRQPLAQAVDQEIQLAVEKTNPNQETLVVENPVDETKVEAENGAVSVVSDLIKLIYFGSVFDVNTLMRAQENVLTRTHERSCCLTYDYVTDDDDAGEPLKEWDLDLLAGLGGLIISRPVNTNLSHKNALEKCVEYAKLWLANSEQAIEPGSGITYAGLREKLDKIMASEYFTTTPQIRVPVEVAAAAGNYAQFQVHGSIIPVNETLPLEGSAVQYQQEEEESPNSHDNGIYDEQTGPVQEHQEEGPEVNHVSQVEAQIEQRIPEKDEDQNSKNIDLKEEKNDTHRRSNSNYRGGRGGPRRGYSNGRGGRRGGYQNEHSQFYGQDGNNYYSRNNYGYRGRGGGRGMGGNYNYYNDAGATS